MAAMSQPRQVHAAVGVALLGALAQLSRFRDPAYAIDDAWISFRIARSGLGGGGLTFNPGTSPVEGMTNLLWTLLSATWIAALPQVDPIIPARVVGGLCYLLAVALLARLAARRTGAWEAALISGICAAASGSLAYHALSGLETGLWGLLFVLCLVLAERAAAGHRAAVAGLGAALAALAATRPEGVLIGLCFCGAGLWTLRRAALPGVLVFAALVGGMEASRLAYYGDLVPNTFYAKPPSAARGGPYGLDFLLYGLGGVGLVVFAAGWRRSAAARWLTGLCVLLAAGAIWSGGDWMAGHRRFTVVTWSAALLAGLAAGRPQTRLWGLLGLLGMTLGPAALAVARPAAGHTDTAVLARLAAQARDSGVRSVAMVDIGRFGWVFEGPIFDMVGLTDRHIARAEGDFNEKTWDEDYFRAWDPALVIIRSETPITDPLPAPPVIGHPDQQALLSILDNGGYRLRATASFGDARHLLVFARDGLALPAAVWGPPPEKDLRQLLVELHEATRGGGPAGGPAASGGGR